MRCIPCVGELSLCVECTAPMASTTTTDPITYDHYRMPEGAKFCHWTYSQISKFYKKKPLHKKQAMYPFQTNING